jgi:PDZ domain-containing protein
MVRFGDAVQVKAGDTLLREDTIGSCFLAVLSGSIVLTRHREVVGEIGPGGHVGDVAILGFGPQPATATAVTPCIVFVLGNRAFLSLAQDVPGLRHGLFPGLSRSEVLTRVRELRSEGLPSWRTLRPTRRPCSRPPARTLPAPTRPTTTLALATEPFVGCPVPLAATLTAPRTRRQRRRSIAVSAGLVSVVALLFLALVPLPYYSLSGDVRSATATVSVRGGRTYPPRGEILFPIIVSHQDTGMAVVHDWFDSSTDIRTSHELFGTDTSEHVDHLNLELMDRAKRSAEAVTRRAVGDLPDTALAIDTGQLGGPSGGLAFALALFDVLTPGELTDGRRVAATGTLAPDGTVGPVSGIHQKTVAMRRAGVQVFLVPAADYDQARAAAGDMRVIAVASFDDALRALAG